MVAAKILGLFLAKSHQIVFPLLKEQSHFMIAPKEFLKIAKLLEDGIQQKRKDFVGLYVIQEEIFLLSFSPLSAYLFRGM
ncbi:MAG: hypothetical protein A2Y28_04120 [Chlamydiae bacterium GWC2_50_10]|nr:MAG: hypothetical protein A2Z85_01490 [Chlamydiae bacterium GWA2_50_15]OGN54736.1 MAG: hypothetical protein A2Y28_04120 [Chlamydiae bacterium GWC2_50_10]OGN57488.1 MAG: hypothetical protein A3D18_04230 [Chlamydiae bacterium RIFCSPHIGHO2_02_FULL_49_29]OGN71096.1 MAG: hypothetical protein A3I15_05470 [Chlamydiae bacterium RIFCSPLOWO2_02_FULL_49_12]OGN73380.1 MAG: hypothetical protein A3G30_02755 [Chlamydiae bacterium RIFCSPLOWO2_12_FULL_49_12]HCJ83792.1 hypothetical protein [Parachlamydiales 